MHETKFIILTSVQSFNLSFPLLFYVISTAILKFPPWFPASPPWFLIFLYFHPDSLHSHADSLHPHSHLIHWHSRPYSPHSPHSDLQFPIFTLTDSQLSLYSLQSHFRKIVALVQNRMLPLLFTSSMTPSVLSPNIIYLIEPQVKNI